MVFGIAEIFDNDHRLIFIEFHTCKICVGDDGQKLVRQLHPSLHSGKIKTSMKINSDDDNDDDDQDDEDDDVERDDDDDGDDDDDDEADFVTNFQSLMYV